MTQVLGCLFVCLFACCFFLAPFTTELCAAITCSYTLNGLFLFPFMHSYKYYIPILTIQQMVFMFLQEENEKKKLSERKYCLSRNVWCICLSRSPIFVGLYEYVHAPFHLFIETRKMRTKNYRPTHLHLFFSKREKKQI